MPIDPEPRSAGAGAAQSTLRRTVRFSAGQGASVGLNTFAGSPSLRGWGRHYEVDVECVGRVDPSLGYLVDIKDVDRAVRAVLLPRVDMALVSGRPGPAELVGGSLTELDSALGGRLRSVRLCLSPFFSLEVRMDSHEFVLIRQRFDFAASHRLHCEHLSDEENRKLFGKCNHPSGHGHNYRVEPCVRVRLAADHLDRFTLDELEAATDEAIIRRFDHKHLNLDTPEFGPGGVNPSVENIAMVFFNLLAPAIKERSADAELVNVTVWETDRTCSSYPA